MPFAATHHHFRQARQRRVSPLWWFLSLSLLLHLGLLLRWQPSFPLLASHQAAGMAVHLVERQQAQSIREQPPAAQAVPTAARAKPAASPKPLLQSISEMPRPSQAPASGIEPGASTTLETMADADKSATEPPAIDEAALQASLKVSLHQELARHFNYPLLARRCGWQGEVLLAFRLETDGRIIDARIARSSGYRVLDHAALTALGKVKRIETGASHGLAMQLPVIYRLEG